MHVSKYSMEAALLNIIERMRVKEVCSYIEVDYLVFEFFMPNFIESFVNVTKDYVCNLFVVVSV